jgi:hypothetical protein
MGEVYAPKLAFGGDASLALRRAVVFFTLFAAYLSYIGEGGSAVFPSRHAYGIATVLVTAAFAKLHIDLQRSLQAEPDSRLGAADVLLYQAVVAVALVSIAFYLHPVALLNWLLVVGGACWLTSRLLLAGRISFERKAVADALLIAVTGVHARLLVISRGTLGSFSDMLLLISRALDRWCAGAPPYGYYWIEAPPGGPHQLPLTYLPLTWLAYLPAHALGVDLRMVNVALELGVYAAGCAIVLRTSPGGSPGRRLLALAALGLYFANGYFVARVDTEMAVYDGVLALLVVALLTDRVPLAFVALALALCVSPLALLVAPFVAVLLAGRIGLARCGFGLAFVAAIVAAILAPFIFESPEAFREGVWGVWQRLAVMGYAEARTLFLNLNLGLLFYEDRRPAFLFYAQASVVAAVFAVFLATRSRRSVAATCSFAALATFGFVTFNLVVWGYLFQPVLLLSALALTAAARSETATARVNRSADRCDPSAPSGSEHPRTSR